VREKGIARVRLGREGGGTIAGERERERERETRGTDGERGARVARSGERGRERERGGEAAERDERREEEIRGVRGTARALRTGYNCLTLKKMGCVRGWRWLDGRTRERAGQEGVGEEDVAEEAAVLREAGGRRRGSGSSGCERRAWRDTSALHVCVARGGEKRHEEANGATRGR